MFRSQGTFRRNTELANEEPTRALAFKMRFENEIDDWFYVIVIRQCPSTLSSSSLSHIIINSQHAKYFQVNFRTFYAGVAPPLYYRCRRFGGHTPHCLLSLSLIQTLSVSEKESNKLILRYLSGIVTVSLYYFVFLFKTGLLFWQ